MSIIRCALVTLLALASWAAALGQRSDRSAVVRGKVLSVDGSLELASVYLEGTNIHTTAGEGGVFALNIPEGQHTLCVQYVGFETYRESITVRRGQRLMRDIRLAPEGSRTLNEQVVIGKSRGRHLREKGFAMEALDTKVAALQNLQTSELLNRSAGVKIRQSAGVGSDVTFNLNGLSGNSVRVFIDGIPLRNYGRSFSLANIPPAMIERIEIYKGVLPAELSEDALGGGINIVLKRDLRSGLAASYSIGSFNTHQWDVSGSYRDRRTGLTGQASAFYNYSDNSYKVWGQNVYVVDATSTKKYVTARRFHDGYLAYGLGAQAGITGKAWADELLLGVMASQTKRDIQTGATMEVVYGARRTEYDSRIGTLQYKKNNLLVRGLDLSTFLTYAHTSRALIDTVPYIYNWYGEVSRKRDGTPYTWASGAEGNKPTLATNTERSISNRTNIHYHLDDRHSLAANFFYDSFTRDIDDPMLSVEERAGLDTRRYSKAILSANYQGRFWGERLRANVFYKHYMVSARLTETEQVRTPHGTELRLIHHNNQMRHSGYGAALSLHLSPRVILLASSEKAVRLPSATELLGNTSENINSSLALRPEQSLNANLGVNLGVVRNRQHDLSVDANLFVRDITDMIQRGVPKATDDTYSFENIGAVISRGIDLEAQYRWRDKFFLTANGSYFDARFNLMKDPYTGVRYAHYRSRLRNAPFLTANAYAEYVLGDVLLRGSRLAVSYSFAYTHEFLLNWEVYGSANRQTVPTQNVHGVGLTFTFPKRRLTLALDAKNILDAQVFDNFALQKPGRSLHAKLTYRIL